MDRKRADFALSIAITELRRHIPCSDILLSPDFGVRNWRVDLRTFPHRLEGFGPLPAQADSCEVEETELNVAISINSSCGLHHHLTTHCLKITPPLPNYSAFNELKVGGFTRDSCALKLPCDGDFRTSLPTVRDEIDEVVEQLLQASSELSCSPLDRRFFETYWNSRMVDLGRSVRECCMTARSLSLDKKFLTAAKNEISALTVCPCFPQIMARISPSSKFDSALMLIDKRVTLCVVGILFAAITYRLFRVIL